MFDLIMFILIISLTLIFIYVIAPILNKSFISNNIESIKIIVNAVVLFVEESFPNENQETKKYLAMKHTKKVLEYLEIEPDEEILEIFINSQIYLLKLSKKSINI